MADELIKQQNIKEPSAELLALDDMTPAIAYKLAERNVITLDDLAEQAVFDIEDIDGLGAELAAKLIMNARKSWFE